MKRYSILALVLGSLALAALACGAGAPTQAPGATAVPAQPAAATADVQATVQAAFAATSQAQAQIQVQVQASVTYAVAQAIAALPPTATLAPTVQPEALADEMTQEELEALIDQAVNEAVAATNAAASSATQATADNTVSSEEAQSITIYTQGAEQAIAYANQLLAAYSQVYGDLAVEALNQAAQIEQQLSAMSQNVAALNATLAEINTTLQQGQALAQATIDQLNSAAQAAQASLSQVQNQTQAFIQKAKDGRAALDQQLANLKPQNVAGDMQGVLQQAFGFLDTVRGALGDGKVDRNEVLQIGQLGVDLQAGLSKHGNEPRFKGLSDQVGGITHSLAHGQFGKTKDGLNQFEGKLGPRPANIPAPGRKRP